MNQENLSQQSLLVELDLMQQRIAYLEAALAEKYQPQPASTQNILIALQISDTCQQLTQVIRERIRAHNVSLYLVDHMRQKITLSLVSGLESKVALDYTDLLKGLSGRVLKTQRPILSQSPADEIDNTPIYEKRIQSDAQSLVILPLFAYDNSHQRCIGTITVINGKDQRVLTADDLNMVQTLIQATHIRLDSVQVFQDTYQAQFDYKTQYDVEHNMSQGVCLISKQTLDVVQMNSRFAEIFGYTSQEILNKPTDFFPNEELMRLKTQFPESAVHYDYWQNEVQNTHKDGSDIWCNVTISSTNHVEHGSVWVCVYTDITDRKQEEERYQYQEHILDFVLDAVVSADLNFNIRSWNKAAEKIYGWAEEEVIGQNATSLFKTKYFDETTSEDFYVTYSEQGIWRGEMIHHHKDGTPIPIRGTSGTVLNDKGEAIGFVTVLRDITNEIDAKQTLEESEERYRIVSELMSDYAFQFNFDDEGNWTHVWATDEALKRITGYDAREVPGTYGLYHPDYVEQVKQDIKKVALGQDTEGEYRIVTKDGTDKWLYIRRRVLWDENHERIIGFYGAGKDITERKRAEQRLIEYNKEKERVNILQNFIQDASHDLKTPLSTINTSIYILNKLATTDKQSKQLAKLQFNVNHLSKLIDDMFTMSGLDMINRLSLARIDFNSPLRDIVRIYRPIVENKNLELITDLHKSSLLTLVNVDLMTQAITNILENSILYSSDEGTITLRTFIDDGWVVIAIEDDGIGISAEELSHIFTRFYRGDKSRGSNTVASTGLGLSIARKIVELHDGHIEVKSEIDEGSCFSIYLPHQN